MFWDAAFLAAVLVMVFACGFIAALGMRDETDPLAREAIASEHTREEAP